MSVVDSIDAPADTVSHEFWIDGTETIWISKAELAGGTSEFGPWWRIIQGDGTPAPGWGNFVSSKGTSATLSGSGNPYRVQVIDYLQNGTGPYELRLNRLTSSTACNVIDLSCDVTVSDEIESVTDTDLFEFTVEDNETVWLSKVELAGGTSDFGPWWRIIQGDGTPAPGWGSFVSSKGTSATLSASGNPYRVQVADYLYNGTGPYEFRLNRLTAATACNVIDLSCDVTTSSEIDSPIDTDLFEFMVQDNEVVWISLVELAGGASDFGPWWRIIQGDGTPAPGWGSFVSSKGTSATLSASGNPYRVQVVDYNYDGNGPYEVTLNRLTGAAACDAVPLTCDVTAWGEIEDYSDTDLFEFAVLDNQTVWLSVVELAGGSSGFGPWWRLRQADGSAAPEQAAFRSGVNVPVTLPAAGNPYVVQVIDYEFDGTGPYEVTVTGGCGFLAPAPERLDARLLQAVPNPFNPQTTIAFDLPEQKALTLQVFDLQGRLVRVLLDHEIYPSGRHETIWNGRDASGRQCASGTYFYRLEAGGYSETKRMVLVK